MAQTEVSSLELIQTHKKFKVACCFKRGSLRKSFCIILHAKYNYSGPKLVFKADHGQCCITNTYTCPVLSNTATYLHNSVKHTCITIACQSASVYLRFNVPGNIFRHGRKHTPIPGSMGSKSCSLLDDTTQSYML